MANLTFIQKQLIDDVFGMKGGYFLDFSNREFEEFMNEVVGYNVYNKYPGLSKAKIFRAFCSDEDDKYVGKAIIIAINYMREKGISKWNNNNLEKLYAFGKKLLGKTEATTTTRNNDRKDVRTDAVDNKDYSLILKNLVEIEKESTQQLKGFAFERFINFLFGQFHMEPRASYKTETDQIDGSFVLGESTVLIEAKYRMKTIHKDDLILFQDKLEHKSTYARGLFISYSEVDDNAVKYFSNHGSRITILYTNEIFQMCHYKADLGKILRSKFRYLDETGCIWSPIRDYEKMKYIEDSV